MKKIIAGVLVALTATALVSAKPKTKKKSTKVTKLHIRV